MIVLRNSSAGFFDPKGSIVLKVQRALRDAGHSPGKIDGDFGRGTEKAVRAYQTAQALPVSGTVDLTTWQALTGQAAPPTIYERALSITASFEGHGYTLAVGNFDGALLTWGIIGYTLGGGNLQKLIKRIDTLDPSAVEDAFGSLTEEWRDILAAPKAKQTQWANAISLPPNKYRLKPEWADAFHRLGQAPLAQQAQNELAQEIYWAKAQSIVKEFHLTGELGACLAFDIAVQNGSVDSADRKHLKALQAQSGPLTGEAHRMQVAEAIARGSKRQYQDVVRGRKMTMATGRGQVNKSNYNLLDWGVADRVIAAEDSPAITAPQAGWATAGDAMVLTTPAMVTTGDDEADFNAFIKSLGLKNFKPYEFLIKGHRNSDADSPAFQTNTNPPRELWPNIAPTARVLDLLRGRLDAPIRTLSAYRSPAYNRAIGGARQSQHMRFSAVDFVAQGNSTPLDWAATLRGMRDEGLFLGGIGVYPTFVHIDTRGFNANF